jgi:hypothetical protein
MSTNDFLMLNKPVIATQKCLKMAKIPDTNSFLNTSRYLIRHNK